MRHVNGISEYAFRRGLDVLEDRIREFFYDDERLHFLGLEEIGHPISSSPTTVLTFEPFQRGLDDKRAAIMVPVADAFIDDEENHDMIIDFLPAVREAANEATANLMVSELT
jgi:hypothetical protein